MDLMYEPGVVGDKLRSNGGREVLVGVDSVNK